MAEEKISDIVLQHLRGMKPEEAERYLARIARDAKEVADEKAAAEQATRNEYAKLSGVELADRLSKAKPGTVEFKLLQDANRDYLAVASIPAGPNPNRVTAQSMMIADMVKELDSLIKNPSKNGARIREINRELAELREVDLH